MSSENVATVRRYVDAFNRRDFDSLIADTDPAVELREWPEAPGAQTYHGPDGFARHSRSGSRRWEWMQLEIEDIIDAGDRVLFSLISAPEGGAAASRSTSGPSTSTRSATEWSRASSSS